MDVIPGRMQVGQMRKREQGPMPQTMFTPRAGSSKMSKHAPGRLIAVVGPSGVGKDSVMRGLAQAADFHLVRRVITRSVSCPHERFEPCEERQFQKDLDAGRFCLHWRAHGLSYAIPDSELKCLSEGRDALVNLSRGMLVAAQAVVPRFAVLNLTASQAVLARRLIARGREPAPGIEKRLNRKVALPEGVELIHVHNERPLPDTVAQALRALSAIPNAPPTTAPIAAPNALSQHGQFTANRLRALS